MLRRAGLALILCLPACDSVRDFYDDDYVLYDPETQAASQPSPQPASQPTEAGPVAVDASAHIRQLEDELEGLDRAIRAGLDENGALAKRRAEVERELLELRRE